MPYTAQGPGPGQGGTQDTTLTFCNTAEHRATSWPTKAVAALEVVTALTSGSSSAGADRPAASPARQPIGVRVTLSGAYLPWQTSGGAFRSFEASTRYCLDQPWSPLVTSKAGWT